MKLKIERSALLKSLGHIQSVVEKRNTIPILSNVLLDCEGGHLSMAATDLDLAISEQVGAEIDISGGITAPAHTLYDIVRKLPDGAQVALAYDDDSQRLVISAGRSRFTLSCLPREDFPVMNEGDLPHSFEVAAVNMKRLIDKTRWLSSSGGPPPSGGHVSGQTTDSKISARHRTAIWRSGSYDRHACGQTD